jgi:hypothetical protein
MHAQGLFGNEDFQLIEFPQKGSFKLGDETVAPLAAEVQAGMTMT